MSVWYEGVGLCLRAKGSRKGRKNRRVRGRCADFDLDGIWETA